MVTWRLEQYGRTPRAEKWLQHSQLEGLMDTDVKPPLDTEPDISYSNEPGPSHYTVQYSEASP